MSRRARPCGYRANPRDAHGPTRLVVFEPKAAHIKSAIRAADDRPYNYPFQIRVLS